MGFYKLTFISSLVLALSLSSTDVSLAARQLLVHDYLPKLTVHKPKVIHHRKFPLFGSLPNVRTQPFLPGSHIPFMPNLPHAWTQPVFPGSHKPSQPNLPHVWTQPFLPGIPIRSQPKPPKASLPKSLARSPALPLEDHVPSQTTLSNPTSPVLPSGQIPSIRAEPALQKSTLPNVPTDPRVKLPTPSATQLPAIPTILTIPSKLPATPHLFTPPHA